MGVSPCVACFFFFFCSPIFSEVMLVSGRVLNFNLSFVVVPPSTCRAPQKNTEVLKTF